MCEGAESNQIKSNQILFLFIFKLQTLKHIIGSEINMKGRGPESLSLYEGPTLHHFNHQSINQTQKWTHMRKH